MLGMASGVAGAAMKTVGAIAGGIMGAASAKRQKKMVEKEQQKNQNWYDKRYNENSTERADAVSALEKMRGAMAERSKSAQGVSAVMGGTLESEALEKQAQTNAMGDTLSNIALAGEQRKSAIESTYMAKDAELSNQLLDIEQKKAAQMAQAAQGVGEAGSGMFGK